MASKLRAASSGPAIHADTEVANYLTAPVAEFANPTPQDGTPDAKPERGADMVEVPDRPVPWWKVSFAACLTWCVS